MTPERDARKQPLHIAKTSPLMAPQNEAGEDLPMRRRRLRYRAWHRGTREMDLILGPFADSHADQMGDREVDQFEGLLTEADTELLKWVLGQVEPPAHIDKELLTRLVAFRTAAAP